MPLVQQLESEKIRRRQKIRPVKSYDFTRESLPLNSQSSLYLQSKRTNDWQDYSLTKQIENPAKSEIYFPSDDVSHETVRRENKIRERKLNDQQQFNDLYRFLNTNNKIKKSVKRKKVENSRNALPSVKNTEKTGYLNTKLNSIAEIEEPESDTVAQAARVHKRKFSMTKIGKRSTHKKKQRNSEQKKHRNSDLRNSRRDSRRKSKPRNMDPNYQMVRNGKIFCDFRE